MTIANLVTPPIARKAITTTRRSCSNNGAGTSTDRRTDKRAATAIRYTAYNRTCRRPS